MPITENTLTLSPAIIARLHKAASRRGMKTEDYTEKLLETTLAVEPQTDANSNLDKASPMSDSGTDILEFLARLPQSPTPRAFATWDEYETFLHEAKNAWDR